MFFAHLYMGFLNFLDGRTQDRAPLLTPLVLSLAKSRPNDSYIRQNTILLLILASCYQN